MRKRKRLYLLLTVCALFIGLFCGSCSVRQDVLLGEAGQGTAEIRIALQPVLVRYFTDLLNFAGEEGAPIFDEYAIRRAFRTVPELKLQDVEVPSRGELFLRLTFSDIEQVFFRQIGSDVTPAVTLTPAQEGWKTSLYLNTENYGEIVNRMMQLTGMSAFEDYLAGLLEPGPEEVIIDMYEYAFEDYLEGESVQELLKNSEIVMDFTAPREILGARGGKMSGRGIRYVIPLLEILTLDEPLYYHFIYR